MQQVQQDGECEHGQQQPRSPNGGLRNQQQHAPEDLSESQNHSHERGHMRSREAVRCARQHKQNRLHQNSVNGSLDLTIPSDSNAEVEASTVSGGIHNDFGLHVNNHRVVGHDLRGELGKGGVQVQLNNVNGRIDIHHAQDGRAMSPVKDRGKHDNDDDDEI
jgi:hypothetical protein